jgi:excinuclease ABC subunit C
MEDEILSFLRGNDKVLKDKLMDKINKYSETLNYEMALELKKELEYINVIMDKQKVELHDFVNRDVWSYYINNGYLSLETLFIRNGKLLNHKNVIYPLNLDVEDEIESYIVRFYSRNEVPKEILVPDSINVGDLSNLVDSSFIAPQKGVKKDLINMATDNAKINLDNKFAEIVKDEERTVNANNELGELLGIDSLNRIDIFDNSNLFGSFAVSGMVVYENGKPKRSEYRKYKVSVDKNDDYNTMKEILYRRYQRAMVEKTQMPELIIVDGGENQIRAALDVLNMLRLNIKVCGLKRNDKHRTSDLVDSNLNIIKLDRTSNVFHYLTRMQDEVHRFTITYHRTLRSKGSISSLLDEIEGIGTVRKKALIKKFGSVAKIREASVEEISEIIPENVAIELKKFLESKDKEMGVNND